MLKKKNIIKKELSRRFFLKDIVFLFLTFFIFCNLNKNLIIKKRKCSTKTIKQNYYFANKTYRTETVKRIFRSYLDQDINAETIMNNIENRRKINEELYVNNTQFLWRRI